MTQKKVKFSVFLLLGLSFTGLQAQEAIPAAGGNDAGSGGSVSYTVGQVFYTNITATNGSAAQGVQQPYEIYAVGVPEEASGFKLICSAFPNPAVDLLLLKVENYDNKKLSYQLYDISGKLLESKKITCDKTSVSIGNYTSAAYVLKVTGNNKEIKVFKILKKQ